MNRDQPSPPPIDLGFPIDRRLFLRRAAAGGLLVGMPSVLAACGGSRTSTTDGSPAKGTDAADQGEQKRGGDLVFGVDVLTGNADPGIFASFGDWMMIDLVARGLTEADFSTGEIKPALAEAWETSRGGRRYVFTLKTGLTFHDGEPVTARDFERSWRRLFDPKDPTQAPGTFAALFLGAPNTLDTFKALDDRRFQVDLERPDVAFPAKCAIQAGVAFSRKAIMEKKRKVGQSPVGAGPFRFVDYTSDQSARFERFDDYYKGAPFLDRFTLQVISEGTALAGALRSGGVQLSSFVPPANVAGLTSSTQVLDAKPYSVHLAFLNVGSPALSDLRVRQAVNFAIDRKAIIRAGFGGRGEEPGYVVPKPDLGYTDELDQLSRQDVTAAKALIKEAGAESRVVRVLAPNNRWWPSVGQIVEQNLQAIGLRPKMEYLDESAAGDKRNDPEQHDIALDTYAAIMPDPDDAAYTLYKSDQSYAQSITQSTKEKAISAKLDELIARGREIGDKDKRAQVYVDLQKIAARELMAHVVLCLAPAPVVAGKGIRGLDPDALGTYRLYAETISLA